MPLTLRNAPTYAEPYRLVLPDQLGQQSAGDLIGRGTGSSVEYQDHRKYYPGDDIRHIDWRAYARTDRLTLKMYRREISPVVDLILDGSLSMAVTDAKLEMARGLVAFFHALAQRLHAKVNLFASGDRLRPLQHLASVETEPPRAEHDMGRALHGAPIHRRRSIKVVVSDFLFPHNPAHFVATLGASADRLVLVMVLSRFEADPEEQGGVKLVDAESGDALDLRLDADARARYTKRLANLQGELARHAQSVGGAFVAVDERMEWSELVVALMRARMVEAG